MNYFNPYYASYPTLTRPSLIKNLFGNINFSSILSGTSKTLNVINQAIPIVKQAGPIYKNAKTMFKVMNEFKKVDTPVSTNNNSNVNETSNEIVDNNQITSTNNDGPTFFL